MKNKLSLEVETLRELTPDAARAVNGGVLLAPVPTPPVRYTTAIGLTPPIKPPPTPPVGGTIMMTPPVRI